MVSRIREYLVCARPMLCTSGVKSERAGVKNARLLYRKEMKKGQNVEIRSRRRRLLRSCLR